MEKETIIVKVRTELSRIYERDGALKASIVVEEAKPKTAALHPHFEWDNRKAAEEFRLEQARRLIRKVRIITVDNREEEIVHVPMIVTQDERTDDSGNIVPASREGEYRVLSDLERDEDLHQRALREAFSDLAAAHRRVNILTDLAKKKGDNDRMAILSVAAESLLTARTALERIH